MRGAVLVRVQTAAAASLLQRKGWEGRRCTSGTGLPAEVVSGEADNPCLEQISISSYVGKTLVLSVGSSRAKHRKCEIILRQSSKVVGDLYHLWLLLPM